MSWGTKGWCESNLFISGDELSFGCLKCKNFYYTSGYYFCRISWKYDTKRDVWINLAKRKANPEDAYANEVHYVCSCTSWDNVINF